MCVTDVVAGRGRGRRLSTRNILRR